MFSEWYQMFPEWCQMFPECSLQTMYTSLDDVGRLVLDALEVGLEVQQKGALARVLDHNHHNVPKCSLDGTSCSLEGAKCSPKEKNTVPAYSATTLRLLHYDRVAAPPGVTQVTSGEHLAPFREHFAPFREHFAPFREHFAPFREHLAPFREHLAYSATTLRLLHYDRVAAPLGVTQVTNGQH
jgi:hypothetical protein